MRFRRATDSDFESILALQEANLHQNLTEMQRADGFLSVHFTRDQFAEMNTGATVTVAEENNRIAGYACSSAREFNVDFPLLTAMLGALPGLTFLGRSLDSSRTCVYGPVCVGRAFRGRGVFRGLIDRLKKELAGRYDCAVAFIAKDNVRSLGAHVDGLGMSLAGEFQHAGKAYWIVAFGIPREAVSCVA
ncbi:MAG: GNAT family N-acetyltransferase [Burkholderiales bacterium]